MRKILMFNVLVAVLCALAYSILNDGSFGLNWDFIAPGSHNFEKLIAKRYNLSYNNFRF
ncbi:hypothetical protein KIT04_110 [Vibrio phage KIT04]|nr:hypothetical protein KIT04_110 [Vibrio phage KIT04]